LKILITGGLGFIGSHLIRKYLSEVDSLYVIDNLSTNSLSPNSPLMKEKKIQFHQMDLSQLKSEEKQIIEEILNKVDLVFHLASPVGVKFIDKNPQASFQSLLKTSQELFPLFEKYQNKVLYASSSEVYGETSDAREENELKIGSPHVMRWGYACGKLASEFLLHSYTFPFVVLRFFNISGPGQLCDHGMVIPSFINRALNNENLTVYGDGKQVRSFCDIRDAVEMIDGLARDKQYERQTFNIGNPDNLIEIESLAKMILQQTKSSAKIVRRQFAEAFSANSADIQNRVMNNLKIKEVYQCRFSTADIIDSIIEHKTHDQ